MYIIIDKNKKTQVLSKIKPITLYFGKCLLSLSSTNVFQRFTMSAAKIDFWVYAGIRYNISK